MVVYKKYDLKKKNLSKLLIFLIISVKIEKSFLILIKVGEKLTKLILKTSAITVAIVLGVSALLFGVLAIFSPVSLAKMFDSVGGYKGAVYFYEKQYQKTKSISDLSTLCLKIDDGKDAIRSEKYLKLFVENEGFEQYCQLLDDGVNSGITNEEYYVGRYACVLITNQKFSSAKTVANSFVLENGYTGFNPFTLVLMEKGGMLNKTQLEELRANIVLFDLSGEQANNADSDLTTIESLLENISD